MGTSIPQLTGTRFQTEPRLRRIQVFQLVLKLIAIGIPAYVVLRIAFGRPLFPVPLSTVALLIIAIGLVCRLRVAWGTALVFQDSAVVLVRGSTVTYSIARESIQRLRCKRDSLTFLYRAERLRKGKVIAREGFSPEDWRALTEYARVYVTAQRKSA